MRNSAQCQYVWIDGSLKNFRTKDKTWFEKPKQPSELPTMEFCGSATDFDVGNLADYYSKPARLFEDPFRPSSGTLVLCDTYSREGLPTFANNRFRLLSSEKNPNQFTFWQTYSVLQADGRPLSHSEASSEIRCGYEVSESHYRASLYAGIALRSSVEIAADGQWRYSIGPLSAIELGDQVWMSRYLLIRIAEEFKVSISLDGCSMQMETESMATSERLKCEEMLLTMGALQDFQMATLQKNVLLKNLAGTVDPYSVLTKVFEALHN